jgi:type I restriction enzyme R subunit
VQRLELHEGIRKLDSRDEDVRALVNDLAATLQSVVAAMNTENFIVRPHLEQVEKYREPQAWESLQPEEYEELARIVSGLPSEQPSEDETAKRFDILVLKTQLAVLHKDKSFTKLSAQIREIAGRLEDKSSVPMVNEQLELIQDLQQDEYWADITLPMLEQIRLRLRDLVKFIDKKERKPIFTNFEDELGEMREMSLDGLISASELERYRRKVMSFLQENENHITIHKLKHNTAITPSDISELERILFESGEVVTKEAFEQAYGKQENLGLFIRRLIGLDREAAKQAFNEYLDGQAFNANQIRFVNLIIDYLTQNGVMDAGKLYEPPFTDFSAEGVDGVFKNQEADRIVSILEQIRENAAA